jgi:hypothetical protein
MFRAELLAQAEASWEELFTGYTALKAITFSSSIEMIMRLADRLADKEVVFGSESILSKEHLALNTIGASEAPAIISEPQRHRW